MNKIIMISWLIICLSACTDSNPLAEKPLDESARLLVQHSTVASVAIGLNVRDAGDSYRQCMESQHPAHRCMSLFKAMSRSFKAEQLTVTPAQVSDKALYRKLAARLARLSLLMEG